MRNKISASRNMSANQSRILEILEPCPIGFSVKRSGRTVYPRLYISMSRTIDRARLAVVPAFRLEDDEMFSVSGHEEFREKRQDFVGSFENDGRYRVGLLGVNPGAANRWVSIHIDYPTPHAKSKTGFGTRPYDFYIEIPVDRIKIPDQ